MPQPTSSSVMRQIINEQLQISESNPIKARYYDYDRFTYPWHFHSQYEIIYVKKGRGCCFVGDCIEQFADGDVILFGPNLPHYMRSDDEYRCGNPMLRVQGTIVQFEENFMQYSFDHYPQFHQIRLLLEESKRGVLLHTAGSGPVCGMMSGAGIPAGTPCKICKNAGKIRNDSYLLNFHLVKRLFSCQNE